MHRPVLASVKHSMRITASGHCSFCLLSFLLAQFGTQGQSAPQAGSDEKRIATSAESLTVLPGFKAELLRSAQKDEGSWICMTADPKGRLIVSPQGDSDP